MNNYINYYYNLNPSEIHQKDKFFYFHLNNEKYYFIVYDRSIDDIKPLYELNLEMLSRGALVHEIILNRDRQPLTFINNIPYILLKVYVNENKKIDLAEISFINLLNENIGDNRGLNRTNWFDLWTAKIDYIEYQIGHLCHKYPLLCESLGYFIGLGENAIMYAKNTIVETKPTPYDLLTVTHRRIEANYTLFDLYNPLSFIIDYKVRDLSEYIKKKFFAGEDVWEELDEYFKHNVIPLYSLRLLYARLLFPTYYFDVYERIVDGNLNEEAILNIISKTDEYEAFLKEFYEYITVNVYIPPITWLNKKTTSY